MGPPLPSPRGPLSSFVVDALRRGRALHVAPPEVSAADPLTDEDLQLALYTLYELHYEGFDGVDDGWEWEPSLLAFRRRLETAFEDAVRAATPVPSVNARNVPGELKAAIAAAGGPSLSTYVMEQGSLRELREFLVHRSAYQLKEADPHTWGIPRLRGEPKAALVHIQTDEYGNGREPEMHASLFAQTMQAAGLDTAYGAYLDLLPAVTLTTVNLVTMFGLHRRLRAALVGHLAVFEMTSVLPMSRYARAVRRLGCGEAAARFYDVHVEADAEHEVIAAHALAAGLAAQDPDLASEILFGARALLRVERAFAEHLLDCWQRGRSSLLQPSARSLARTAVSA